MISFHSVNDALDFINNLGGGGIVVTDDEELREQLTSLLSSDSPPSGNDAAFVIKFKDLLAPGAISDWITRAEMENVSADKIANAEVRLRLVLDFQSQHKNQCQLPG